MLRVKPALRAPTIKDVANFVGAVEAAEAAGRARLHFHVLGTFRAARWVIKSA